MSFSYSARDALSEISKILDNGNAESWKKQAMQVSDTMRSYLWWEQRGACFDRDHNGKRLETLLHNNLRCMYFGSFRQEMADRFVKEHLLNPHEFWTPFPLPSVAVNDPLYDNESDNSWSGQPQGLTYQRAIRALETYGYESLVTRLGHKLFTALQKDFIFPQQFDPCTGKRQGDVDGYGPTMLSVLEYISRMFGIHMERNELWCSAVGEEKTQYSQIWGENTYMLRCSDGIMEAAINGKPVYSGESGVRIVTDLNGEFIRRVPII